MLYVTVSLTISMEASADRRRCIDYGQQSGQTRREVYLNYGYVGDILSRRHGFGILDITPMGHKMPSQGETSLVERIYVA